MQQRRTGTGQVRITVNGRSYKIGCDAGEEDRIVELGQYLDGRVAELAARVGQVGDERLLLMTALVLADDLAEAVADLEAVRQTPAQSGSSQPGSSQPGSSQPDQERTTGATPHDGAGGEAGQAKVQEAAAAESERVNALASRVEGIAARLASA
ncbi:cell division protein ZapA [Marinibaculum pumilum]|uniref:Cell division protein ZapA n=1 Tax=Marinibaculum pumilum TaxID=1766165 RepID=A0ABV7L6U2_9PROT